MSTGPVLAGAGVLAARTRETPAESMISPGVVGFLATFAIVVASVVLLRSMAGRLRRVDHRARLLEAEQAHPSGRSGASSPDASPPEREGRRDAAAPQAPEPGGHVAPPPP